MGRTEQIVASLAARRDQVGNITFHCLARRLSMEARYVLFRVLGGDSLQELGEALAQSHLPFARAQRPTEKDLAAAEAELQYLLSEIEARFQLAWGGSRSDIPGRTMATGSPRR
jgi:hypothetical protein